MRSIEKLVLFLVRIGERNGISQEGIKSNRPISSEFVLDVRTRERFDKHRVNRQPTNNQRDYPMEKIVEFDIRVSASSFHTISHRSKMRESV